MCVLYRRGGIKGTADHPVNIRFLKASSGLDIFKSGRILYGHVVGIVRCDWPFKVGYIIIDYMNVRVECHVGVSLYVGSSQNKLQNLKVEYKLWTFFFMCRNSL